MLGASPAHDSTVQKSVLKMKKLQQVVLVEMVEAKLRIYSDGELLETASAALNGCRAEEPQGLVEWQTTQPITDGDPSSQSSVCYHTYNLNISPKNVPDLDP